MRSAESRIRQLPWDSDFFGMPIGRVAVAINSEEELLLALDEARGAGLRIVYWLDENDVILNVALKSFSGRRIVGHCIYEKALSEPKLQTNKWPIVSLAPSFPLASILPLALLAGRLSRFRLDDRLSGGSFEKLYSLWIERSLQREIATDVLALVANESAPGGLVTYHIDGKGVSTVGLVSTAPSMQRKGLGSELLARAEQDSHCSGAAKIRVSTQSENVAACQLYAQRGYNLVCSGSYFHFFPFGNER